MDLLGTQTLQQQQLISQGTMFPKHASKTRAVSRVPCLECLPSMLLAEHDIFKPRQWLTDIYTESLFVFNFFFYLSVPIAI